MYFLESTTKNIGLGIFASATFSQKFIHKKNPEFFKQRPDFANELFLLQNNLTLKNMDGVLSEKKKSSYKFQNNYLINICASFNRSPKDPLVINLFLKQQLAIFSAPFHYFSWQVTSGVQNVLPMYLCNSFHSLS